MGSWKNKLTENEMSMKGYYGISSEYSTEMCLLCGTEFTYYECQDDTPGFKEHTITLIDECKCGRCNNWVFDER